VFEIRVLRRVFEPKRDEVTGECGDMDWIGLERNC
jgi:hypothetical protein